jgi:Tol biopolymer transport system component
VLLLGTEFNEDQGAFSPDGRWIAYRSNESGRPEIYVRPFNPSGPSLGDGQWQISRDGGAQPKWRADGKEIVFRAPDGSPIAVDVSANGRGFQLGLPTQLFAAPTNQDWDVTADCKRFLMLVSPASQNAQTPITVVLNWQADLKR